MNVLQGWLEFIDARTGLPQRLDELDRPLPGTQTMLCRNDQHSYIIRDLSGKNEVLVNSRPVVEAQLSNLDHVQIGSSRYLFRAAYLPIQETFEPVLIAELDPSPTIPPPVAFTTQVQATRSLVRPLLQLKPYLLPCSIAALILLEALVDSETAPLFIHLAITTLGTTLAFGPLMVLSAVSGKDVSSALKFALQAIILPLSAQFFFFSCATHAHLSNADYFLASLIPCSVFLIWVGRMSSFKFAAAALIPWTLFLTGLMSFIL